MQFVRILIFRSKNGQIMRIVIFRSTRQKLFCKFPKNNFAQKRLFEPSYFKNRSQTQKNGLSYPPKRIMYVWPNPLRWGTTWTYFRSSQKHLSIRCHGQLWFFKKCTQKMLFFQRFWLEKRKKCSIFSVHFLKNHHYPLQWTDKRFWELRKHIQVVPHLKGFGHTHIFRFGG